jgi:thioredoxin-related protein
VTFIVADSPIRPRRDASFIESADGNIRGLTRVVIRKLLPSLLLLLVAPLAAAPPVSEAWLEDVSAARSRARQEGKPILVDLWADWCTWCKRLDREVFSTPTFREYAARFVLLRVDTEDGAGGTRLMEDFEVESLPTTLIVTHDLVRIGELRGFAPVEPYIQNLELERAMYAALVRAYDDHRAAATKAARSGSTRGRSASGGAVEAGSDGDRAADDTLQTLADELHARRDGARAAELYREILARGGSNVEVAAWNHYYYADSLRLQGAWDEALAATAAARAAVRAVDDDELVERIDLLPYRVARDAVRCDQARTALERFLTDHPAGVYSDVAQEALRRMKSTETCA